MPLLNRPGGLPEGAGSPHSAIKNLSVEPVIFLTGRSISHSSEVSVLPCLLNAKLFAISYLSKFTFLFII